jgi:hypothetical protein
VAFKENLSGRGYFGYKPKIRINDNKNLIQLAAPPPSNPMVVSPEKKNNPKQFVSSFNHFN